MPKLSRQFLKCLIAILTLSLALIVGVVVYQGKQLASPQRRSLQAYHASWLDSPESHGVKISRKLCYDGKVPTLIVEPSTSGALGKRGELIREQLRAKGAPVALQGDIVANVVLLHGRNGRKEDLLPVAERFCAVGLRCIIPDLPAHGDSPVNTVHFGQTEWESKLAERVLLESIEKLDHESLPCALWGMSMGGSFATHSVSLGGGWSSLTIVCSFDRLDRVLEGQSKFKLFSEAVSSVGQMFGGVDPSLVTPDKWAERVMVPTLVAHGDQDQLISLEQGKSLYGSISAPKKRWLTVDGGTHSNILTTPMPLYAEMAEWIILHASKP